MYIILNCTSIKQPIVYGPLLRCVHGKCIIHSWERNPISTWQ